jgi:hypothetical protein
MFSWVLLSGCAGQQSLSQEEIEIQNKADLVVSGLLFDRELDQTASYNVRKDGFVVIKFDKSVPSETYTRVVEMLRSNPDIRGVRAEQGGREVCKLMGYR